MKKIILSAALLSSILLVGCTEKEKEEVNIVSYDGGFITEDDLVNYLKESYSDEALKELVYSNLLKTKYKDLIPTLEKEVLKELEKYGNEEAQLKYIENSGFKDSEDYINYHVVLALEEKSLLDNFDFESETVKKEMEKYKNPIKVNAILLGSKEEADSIYKKLEKGEDFIELSNKHSLEAEQYPDSEYGFINFESTETDPNLFDNAHLTKLNNFSKPFEALNYEGYYYIVKPLEIEEVPYEEWLLNAKYYILYNNYDNSLSVNTYKKLLNDFNAKILDSKYDNLENVQ